MKGIIDSSAKYGIVIDNEIGVIRLAEIEGDEMRIYYHVNGKESVIKFNYAENETGRTFKAKNIYLTFNEDGTAKGKTMNGENIFILLGEKLTDNEVVVDLAKKGLRKMLIDLEVKNRLPRLDATILYYHQTDSLLQISFVFPIDFIHPFYGKQEHIRVFKYIKNNEKWTIKEDNTSVIL